MVALIVLLGFGAHSADADDFTPITWEATETCTTPKDANVNGLDGGTTKVRYESLTSNVLSAANDRLVNVYNPTNLGIVWVSAGYDVKLKDKNYSSYCGFDWHGSGGVTVGLYHCWKLKVTGAYSGACDKAVLRFDTSYTSVANWSDRKALVCHEFGHATGLTHEGSDCMKAAAPWPSDGLDAHGLNHLDDYYLEP